MKKRIHRKTQRVEIDQVTGETHVTVLDVVQNAFDDTWRYIERRWGEFASIEEGQRFLKMVAERVEGMRTPPTLTPEEHRAIDLLHAEMERERSKDGEKWLEADGETP